MPTATATAGAARKKPAWPRGAPRAGGQEAHRKPGGQCGTGHPTPSGLVGAGRVPEQLGKGQRHEGPQREEPVADLVHEGVEGRPLRRLGGAIEAIGPQQQGPHRGVLTHGRHRLPQAQAQHHQRHPHRQQRQRGACPAQAAQGGCVRGDAEGEQQQHPTRQTNARAPAQLARRQQARHDHHHAQEAEAQRGIGPRPHHALDTLAARRLEGHRHQHRQRTGQRRQPTGEARRRQGAPGQPGPAGPGRATPQVEEGQGGERGQVHAHPRPQGDAPVEDEEGHAQQAQRGEPGGKTSIDSPGCQKGQQYGGQGQQEAGQPQGELVGAQDRGQGGRRPIAVGQLGHRPAVSGHHLQPAAGAHALDHGGNVGLPGLPDAQEGGLHHHEEGGHPQHEPGLAAGSGGGGRGRVGHQLTGDWSRRTIPKRRRKRHSPPAVGPAWAGTAWNSSTSTRGCAASFVERRRENRLDSCRVPL
jgi:hypothetical protein